MTKSKSTPTKKPRSRPCSVVTTKQKDLRIIINYECDRVEIIRRPQISMVPSRMEDLLD